MNPKPKTRIECLMSVVDPIIVKFVPGIFFHRPNPRNLPANALCGFTLIEILMVLLMIGVVLVPMFTKFMSSLSSIEDLNLYQMAAALNTTHMETYRNQPYRQISMITSELELAIPDDLKKKLSSKIQVKEILPGRLLKIVITTTFKTGRKTALSLATLLANQKPMTGFPQ